MRFLHSLFAIRHSQFPPALRPRTLGPSFAIRYSPFTILRRPSLLTLNFALCTGLITNMANWGVRAFDHLGQLELALSPTRFFPGPPSTKLANGPARRPHCGPYLHPRLAAKIAARRFRAALRTDQQLHEGRDVEVVHMPVAVDVAEVPVAVWV